jgi:hypothetical protein
MTSKRSVKDRAVEQADYAAWKILAGADLLGRHDVKPGTIPERLWRRLFIEGMTPQEAADYSGSRHLPRHGERCRRRRHSPSAASTADAPGWEGAGWQVPGWQVPGRQVPATATCRDQGLTHRSPRKARISAARTLSGLMRAGAFRCA